jgi:energy-coupling factor transport system ATP-binding protein
MRGLGLGFLGQAVGLGFQPAGVVALVGDAVATVELENPAADKVLVMSRKKIAMYDTVEKVFARAPELLELGLSVPQVTKIFLKLREMGVDVPADVYTIPYAVKMILAAKARRDAGETLVLPRNEEQKGGAAGC